MDLAEVQLVDAFIGFFSGFFSAVIKGAVGHHEGVVVFVDGDTDRVESGLSLVFFNIFVIFG